MASLNTHHVTSVIVTEAFNGENTVYLCIISKQMLLVGNHHDNGMALHKNVRIISSSTTANAHAFCHLLRALQKQSNLLQWQESCMCETFYI